jgi:hypothetical protein
VTTFPLPLNASETILKTDEHASHVKNNPLGLGYNVVFGALWLTDQRLVFRSAVLGSTLSYPLSRVASAARKEVRIWQKQSQYSSGSFDAALSIEFDNGGREYFITPAGDLSAWAAAILSAKSAAPDLPFTQVPPARSAVEQGSRGLWVIIGIMAGIVLLFLCTVFACVGLPFLLALFGQK